MTTVRAETSPPRAIGMLSLMCALTLLGCGGNRPSPEVETFREPNPGSWQTSTHELGRGRFEPRNVGFGPSGLTLTLPAGSLDGGELQGRAARGSGTFTARMRTAVSPGSISAFFLYRHDHATDSSDELDFEIPGGAPHRVIVTVWRRGTKVPVDQRTVPLAFDPAAALHEYELRRDGTHVTFSIDAREVFASAQAPSVELRPIFNAWYPDWQQPATPPVAGHVVVDRFSYRAS